MIMLSSETAPAEDESDTVPEEVIIETEEEPNE